MTDALTWTCMPFAALSAAQLYDALRLRTEVFVMEQNCVFQDMDGSDDLAWHVQGRDAHGHLLAYSRLFQPGVKYPEASIGRVVSAPQARGQGLGQHLMRHSLAQCQRHWPGQAIRIGAQARLERFYLGFGFVTASTPYLEDGIEHIEMVHAPTVG